MPGFILTHPALSAIVMASLGILGNWAIVRNVANWPPWMLFPSMIVAVVCLLTMVIGLGILTVRLLEPALALMDLNWDAEPLAQLGIPLSLQRKCERLGYWTAEDLVRDIDTGKFPWTLIEYDERMQLERAAARWNAQPGTGKRRRGLLSRRQPAANDLPANDRGR
ncbi:MAG TPA: hypothetical protein VFV93_05250 [Thermomicrobiales bacterium]|nr:hypothetical protein [Thermomicrobiales bacterium]